MEPPAHPPRKSLRLDRDTYSDPRLLCSITIATQNRVSIFADPTIAAATVDVLKQHAIDTGVRVHAYCVMPDHVHLLAAPSENCDLISFVGQFKNLSLRAAWLLGVQGTYWQRRFWDHFLRADEDIQRVVEYVL